MLKTDCGSETCDIATLHCFLTGSNHCVKSVQILRKSVQIFSPNAGKYGPEKTLYLDTFHTMNLSHRYGASNANQRLENWWSHFKRSFSAWVIDYFKQLVHDGIFVPGNVVHVECIWFVYADFLQRKLDEVRNEWNLHTIKYRKGCQVSGILNHLYYLPGSKGYAPQGHQIS